jgi:hypothetical protein
MALLCLTQGFSALIDGEDVSLVSGYRWHAYVTARGTVYVKRSEGPRAARRTIYLHRQLLGFPDGVVDHANGDGLDNRRANLRVCSQGQNLANTGPRPTNRTGFKGVFPEKGGRFRASAAGRYIGCFDTAVDAALAHDERVSSIYGEFARLNFPAGVSS